MTEEGKIKVQGVVVEVMPGTQFPAGTQFRVKLDDGQEVQAYLSSKVNMPFIGIILGDRVTVEISPNNNASLGRIVSRPRKEAPSRDVISSENHLSGDSTTDAPPPEGKKKKNGKGL